jgi:topoisomerase-4 subunit A
VPVLPEDSECELVMLIDTRFPQLKIDFGGKHKDRPAETIDADEFIAVKGIRAKGKRLSNYTVKLVSELEPLEKEPLEDEAPETDTGQGNETDSFEPKGGYNGEQMSLNL